MRIDLGLIAIDIDKDPGSIIPSSPLFIKIERNDWKLRKIGHSLFRSDPAISFVGIQVVLPVVWWGKAESQLDFSNVDALVCPHLRITWIRHLGFEFRLHVFPCRAWE